MVFVIVHSGMKTEGNSMSFHFMLKESQKLTVCRWYRWRCTAINTSLVVEFHYRKVREYCLLIYGKTTGRISKIKFKSISR